MTERSLLEVAEFLRPLFRTISNWPKEGVQFCDITTVISNPEAFSLVIDTMAARYHGVKIDAVAGLEARGFIFAAALAYKMKLPFIPIRKQGKLPAETIEESYQLEYGEATLEIHKDALQPKQKVLLCDDLIATGGSFLAAIRLLKRLQVDIVEAAALVDLPFLGGSTEIKRQGVSVFSLVDFND